MNCELVGSTFYLFKHSFDSIPISLGFMLKSEVIAVKRGLKPRCSIGEKEGVGDVVFFTEFVEKPLGESDRTRRMKPDVEKFAGYGINRR